ncbi:MAG: UPF0182 family protein [Eubacterium sp.]|nr:UPF0182 family protein [Eubacterium sp.]
MKKKSRKFVFGVGAALVVVLGLGFALNHFYIDYLWFSEVGYTNIFFKELVTKLTIGIPIFLLMLVLIFFYLRFLSRLSTRYLGAVKVSGGKLEGRIALVIAAAAALIIALSVVDNLWMDILQFVNRGEFGETDALFNMDLSFYFFTLPLLKGALGVVISCFFGMVLLTLAYTAYRLYREKDFRVQTQAGMKDAREDLKALGKAFLDLASRQIGLFLAVFFLLLALGAFIERYGMVYGGTGMVYGAGASDTVIGLKVIYIKIALCAVLAVTSLIAGIKKNYKMMIGGPVCLIALVILGSLGQLAYEYAVVVPNQYTKEAPYIEKNIASTQKAYGLDKVEIKEFSPTQEITPRDISENQVTIDNISINDQSPTKDMYNSLQGIRNYYKFYDVDVDRYYLDGTYTQVFLGTREMDNASLPEDARTWVNQHLKYTHGFGIAMSPVNKTNAVGQPELAVKDIPPKTGFTSLEIDEPRIYYGEGNYEYAITGAQTPEFDYPEGENNKEVYYKGTGGIALTPLNRLAFALYYQSPEMLLTGEITSDSKILMRRNVMDRVKRIAPFLEYDEDAYMVLAEGRQYWIIDGFTTSSRYPYAQPYNDAGQNYIKNPVKIVVDAYNGDVTFYQVEKEPLLETYNRIYPGLVKDISEMPQGLKAHIRYSKTLFDIQADVYKTYHMTNSQVFYNREDQWETANQFFGDSKEEVAVDSAYTIMKLPERDTEFMLTTAFTPRNKDNMNAWLAGVSDGDQYGKLLLYQFPKQQLVYGPMQIEQRIDQNTTISPQLTLLSQQGSRVLRGNLMTIPIEDALIYVEPIYIQASSGENNLPEMKKVIVSYQNDIVMADSLDQALAQIFDYDAEASQAPQQTQDTQKPQQNSTAADLSAQASKLLSEAQQAQQSGDWAGYGEKLKALETVLGELKKATGAQ